MKTKIFNIPGLDNSGPKHWQSVWEKELPNIIRIEQDEWIKPVRTEWVTNIEKELAQHDGDIILTAHSLGCATVAYWAQQTKQNIKGALLVAPSDVEAPTYPEGTTGFKPMPLNKLPFRSIVVASSNDYYVSIERAEHFAKHWGSEFVMIGDAGHINSDSNLGRWEKGIELLSILSGKKIK